MQGNYLHGVEVLEMSGTPPIKSIDSSMIGLIGTLEYDALKNANFHRNQSAQASFGEEKEAKDFDTFFTKPYLVSSLEDFHSYFGKDCTGTLIEALKDIYSQTAAKVVVAPIKEASQLDEGIKLLEKSSETLKVVPKLLVAPGLIKTEETMEVALAPSETAASSLNEFAQKLVALAFRLKAIALVDLKPKENTLSSIKEATVKLTGSDRLYLLYPEVIVKRRTIEGLEVYTQRPASTFVAGLIAKSDVTHGYWASPSNQQFSSISALSEEISFALGESNCLANQLNEENITTIVWQEGYRLWGNKSYIKEGIAKNFEFLSVRRTADVLNMTLFKNHFWAIDKGITKNLKDTLVDSVNVFMRSLKMQGAIINGKCWADQEKNTIESLANGHFYLNFDFTAPYPAERITFLSYLTKDYLSEVLS